jgi:hypothetical protein
MGLFRPMKSEPLLYRNYFLLFAVQLLVFLGGCTFDRFNMSVDRGALTLSSTNHVSSTVFP